MKRVLLVVLAYSAFSVLAYSQILLQENFDDTAYFGELTDLIDQNTGQPIATPQKFQVYQPAGWTITSEINPGDTSGFNTGFPYPAWTVLYFAGEWGSLSVDRFFDAQFMDGILVADSDRFGDLAYRTWATSPTVEMKASSLLIEFDSHYKNYNNQVARLEISWDGKKTYQTVFQWDDNNRPVSTEHYIDHIKISIPVPSGAPSFTLRFFYGGDQDEGGFANCFTYWAIDNVTVSDGGAVTAPAAPTLRVASKDPTTFSDVVLTGSPYSGSSAHAKSEWQVSLDPNFDVFIFNSGETKTDLTSIGIPGTSIPLEVPFYARVRYIDQEGFSSEYSTPVKTTIAPPSGLTPIVKEDFESTAEFALPTGWKDVNFNDPGGNPFTVWMVLSAGTLSAFGSKRTGMPVYQGNSVFSNSDGWDGFQDDHLFSKSFNLSGVKNVWVTFWSNYMQNQDNIGVLEYSVDGGDLDSNRNPTGTWLPVLYYLDRADITFTADGLPDAAQTFRDDNIADGTYYPFSYWAFAQPLDSLGSYILPGTADNPQANKSYLKFRLPAADDRPNVILRWSTMGTNSWFWGIDNVTIWGDKGTDVSEWSLF